MPVPANRVPVRVARGDKSVLDANLASLSEGEICYAKDENTLYVVEAGVLTSLGSDLTLSSVDELSDVSTSAAVEGDMLVYTSGVWTSTAQPTPPDTSVFSRGDGGDFDAGTVDKGFVLGIYGAGDATGTVDYPVEQIGAFDGGVA